MNESALAIEHNQLLFCIHAFAKELYPQRDRKAGGHQIAFAVAQELREGQIVLVIADVHDVVSHACPLARARAFAAQPRLPSVRLVRASLPRARCALSDGGVGARDLDRQR